MKRRGFLTKLTFNLILAPSITKSAIAETPEYFHVPIQPTFIPSDGIDEYWKEVGKRVAEDLDDDLYQFMANNSVTQ